MERRIEVIPVVAKRGLPVARLRLEQTARFPSVAENQVGRLVALCTCHEAVMFSERTTRRIEQGRVPLLCLAVFTVVWVLLAIRPRYRADWVLENLLTFVCVPLAVLTYRRFSFSDRAYVQATLFVILNTIGSHYTYSEVPVGDWMREAFGFHRNHYDRLVHFSFGLLMLLPIRELAIRNPRAMGRIAVSYLSIAAVAFWSIMYEIIEWLVASVADPAAGTAYLGTQGDVWDAQKDMALACTGALVAAFLDRPKLSRR